MYKRLPKLVPQTLAWSCWAAGLESWLDVTPFRAKLKQDELIQTYATNDDGGLDGIDTTGANDRRDLKSISEDLSITFEGMRGADLTFDYLNEKLKISHLLLMYSRGPKDSHANVCYGVGMPDGKEMMLSIMEPSPGIYINRLLSFYARRKVILIGWAAPI